VSEDLSAVLDVEDAVDHRYTLEVSSPGLDRPLRGADDYVRFTGCLAKIVVTEAVEGQTHFEGRLAGLDGVDVLVADGKQRIKRVPLALISRARLAVEF
jgi:ribosome maturation factor RimP